MIAYKKLGEEKVQTIFTPTCIGSSKIIPEVFVVTINVE